MKRCHWCGSRDVTRQAKNYCSRECYIKDTAYRKMRGLIVPSDEATEEELNQVIAEQMQCLPSWWELDTRRMRKRDQDF